MVQLVRKAPDCEGWNFAGGKRTWDYFSEKDGEVHSFDLCESCYDELTNQFKISVQVKERTELL